MPRMVTAIRIYPYIAPLVLAPLSLWLWWSRYANWPQALLAWLIPVLWAYIVPGIGTNVRGVWEFNTALKLGRFRPHHGFVFGSATAMLAWLAHGAPAHTLADVARWALLLSALLGFWNWLYEIKALQADVLRVYNQPWADGGGPEAIAYDYAPWIFAGFGAAYGACIAGAECRGRTTTCRCTNRCCGWLGALRAYWRASPSPCWGSCGRPCAAMGTRAPAR